MKHAEIIDRRIREPAFDLPPRFTGVHDRRLGGRVAARWKATGNASRSQADDLRAALTGGNLVWLRWCGKTLEVSDIGALVAATFSLQPGRLERATAFARALGDAAALSVSNAAPAPFEGSFSRVPGAPPTLLTRGVVVPINGEDAAQTACAVVTWTELLAPGDSAQLRRELLSALAAAPPRVRPVTAAMW